jgi:plasmid stabilization system protein ParE
MISVVLSARALRHLQRIADLLFHEVRDLEQRILGIQRALTILEESPELGRPAGRFRELVIGRGSRGYIARYRFDSQRREVVVLAIRGQREAGYRR